MNWPYWFELAVVFGLTSIGTILLGHFEAGSPRWRGVLKLAVFAVLGVAVSATAGRFWFFALLALVLMAVLIIHAWWLPKNGVNGWTGEPRERYYALRGWRLK